MTGSPFQLSEAITGNGTIVADPLNRFMFVTNNSGNDVHVLNIGQSGALTEATNSPFAVSAPDFIAINPAGALAYVPDSTDGDIFIFSVGANGSLTSTVASPLIVGIGNNSPHFALVHPNGNFLYTANLQTIGAYSIDPIPANGGALTQLGGSPYTPAIAGDGQVAPLVLVLDNSGQVSVCGAGGNGWRSYGIPERQYYRLCSRHKFGRADSVAKLALPLEFDARYRGESLADADDRRVIEHHDCSL